MKNFFINFQYNSRVFKNNETVLRQWNEFLTMAGWCEESRHKGKGGDLGPAEAVIHAHELTLTLNSHRGPQRSASLFPSKSRLPTLPVTSSGFQRCLGIPQAQIWLSPMDYELFKGKDSSHNPSTQQSWSPMKCSIHMCRLNQSLSLPRCLAGKSTHK